MRHNVIFKKILMIYILTFFCNLHEVAFTNTIVLSGDIVTIQSAINASATGDTVLVETGVYFETINFYGKSIVLLSGNGPDSTIISAERNPHTPVINFVSGEDTCAIISGFTIRNGSASQGGGIVCRFSSPKIQNNIIVQNRAALGAGIYCSDGSNPIIKNNIITRNVSYGGMFYGGGGIYIKDSGNITISENIISENSAYDGGGILVSDSSYVIIVNNEIAENSISHSGGGIYCGTGSKSIIKGNYILKNFGDETTLGGGIFSAGDPNISNNVIEENTVGYGAGVYLLGGEATVDSNQISKNFVSGPSGTGGGLHVHQANEMADISFNLIVENKAYYAGGIFIRECQSLRINNNTIISNEASDGGGGMAIYNSQPCVINNIVANTVDGGGITCRSANPIFKYNNVWKNTGGNYVGCSYDIENLSQDPIFVGGDPFDYHLSENSPCIDAGDPESPFDPDESRADIGAFYFPHESHVSQDQNKNIPSNFKLQMYPNPFNSQITIRYQIPGEGQVNLFIYNILGQNVAKLVEGEKSQGFYEVIWNVKDVLGKIIGSSVYIVTLQFGPFMKTSKVMFLQ